MEIKQAEKALSDIDVLEGNGPGGKLNFGYSDGYFAESLKRKYNCESIDDLKARARAALGFKDEIFKSTRAKPEEVRKPVETKPEESSPTVEQVSDLYWRIHTPRLMEELFCNPGTSALSVPFNIFNRKLYDLAELALEIDDPRLHMMMMDLTLYEDADPYVTPLPEINAKRAQLAQMIEEMKA